MQQLVDNAANGLGDFIPLGSGQPGQAAVQAQQLGLDNFCGALTQRGDRRGDLRHPLAGQVPGDLVVDDLTSSTRIVGRRAGGRLTLDALHVHHDHAGQPGHRRVDIARHAQITEDQLTAALQGVVHISQGDHRPDRTGTGHHHIGLSQGLVQVVQCDRLSVHTGFACGRGETPRALGAAVDHPQVVDARANQLRGGQRAH
ncbi:Uncharacterised protein [Mycobacteroides abscessus subsp. abscessus]|nr:Uncharacterised protein [Mycobacteroides abscessus subsp. abscessus]SHW79746.1 Uncharacterised protein [Mycobacteroides abscessus subsp. abscessus]SIF05853.1 Uncharacterised protein [Mycobacteroides abscessus subsp. abscessus]SKX06333.1 Uncharacterised protein [Mycobacteroides abscessus subsp. abscessus]